MLSQEISVYHFWEEVKRNNSKKRQLVECLLACSNIKDEGARTTLLNQLPSWVSNISSHSQLKIHVTQIVNTCLEYRGGIEQLVDILFFYEEDSNAARNLSEVLQELYPLPIAWAKVAKLKSLLNNVSEEKLLNIREAYLAKDISLPPICYEGNVLTSLIDGLVRMGQLSTGKVPILEFVRRVTPYVNDSKALDNWVNDVAKYQFQLTQEEINQLGNDPVCRPPKPLSCHLLIKLDQANPNLDAYHVQAWLAKNAEKAPSIIYSSSEAKPLAEIAQVVDNI